MVGGKVEVHSLPSPPRSNSKGYPLLVSGRVSGRWSMMGGSLGRFGVWGFWGLWLSPSSNLKHHHPAQATPPYVAVLLAPTVALALAPSFARNLPELRWKEGRAV